jgi:DNA gyrase/topoisomerase IV subunit A
MTMTIADLLRALANETERREQLEQELIELKQELNQARASTFRAEPKELLSVLEAARYINRSPSYLHKDRIQLRRIPFIQEKTGSRALYCRTDLDTFIESRRRTNKKAA